MCPGLLLPQLYPYALYSYQSLISDASSSITDCCQGQAITLRPAGQVRQAVKLFENQHQIAAEKKVRPVHFMRGSDSVASMPVNNRQLRIKAEMPKLHEQPSVRFGNLLGSNEISQSIQPPKLYRQNQIPQINLSQSIQNFRPKQPQFYHSSSSVRNIDNSIKQIIETKETCHVPLGYEVQRMVNEAQPQVVITERIQRHAPFNPENYQPNFYTPPPENEYDLDIFNIYLEKENSTFLNHPNQALLGMCYPNNVKPIFGPKSRKYIEF